MASKRRLRRKACESKRRHTSEANARIEVRHARTGGLHAYKCQHCSGWHVGHPPAHVRQAIAERRTEKYGWR